MFKKSFVRMTVALAAVLCATPAFAAKDDIGLQLALRAGFALPMGDVASGVKLSDAIDNMIPIQLDVGYRFTPNITAGAFFSYGFMSPKVGSAHDIRLGIEGMYNFMPAASWQPWVGLGVGYEIVGGDADLKGFEYVNAQVGVDYAVSPKFSVGPFAMFSFGSYSSSHGVDIANTSTHEWLTFGLKGTFNL